MAIWIPLISAVIGGLLTVIPVLITLRNQAIEREKDRQEQRREAKTQLALELMRNDVKIIDDVIHDSFKGLNYSRNLAFRRDRGKISHDEMLEELEATVASDTFEVDYIVDSVASTFGNEFYSHYKDWENLVGEFSDLMLSTSSEEKKDEELDELWNKIIVATGKLHILLKEKLISLRE